MGCRIIIYLYCLITAAYSNNVCLKAIEQSAHKTRISSQLLMRIAQVESGIGKNRQPWPWTINIQGRAYYFKTASGCLQYIQQLLRQGFKSFDVGCFQVNWRWHGHKVQSPAHLLEPRNNALIAAQYLTKLTQRHSTLVSAVAHYHSPHPLQGRLYAQRVFGLYGKDPIKKPIYRK